MKDNLPSIKQNSQVVLQKTKSLIALSNKILSNQKYELENEDWMERLWQWADENSIEDLEQTINKLGEECITGLPKNRKDLLRLTQLDLGGYDLQTLPKEIVKLTHLTSLFVSGTTLTELPDEIISLTNLVELDLSDNPRLILTLEQESWIHDLIINGHDICIDPNLLTVE